MLFFWRAPAWAFLTFFRAAWRCFCVAIAPPIFASPTFSMPGGAGR
jgi:hypothetical protein